MPFGPTSYAPIVARSVEHPATPSRRGHDDRAAQEWFAWTSAGGGAHRPWRIVGDLLFLQHDDPLTRSGDCVRELGVCVAHRVDPLNLQLISGTSCSADPPRWDAGAVERRRHLVLQLGIGAIHDAGAIVAVERRREVARPANASPSLTSAAARARFASIAGEVLLTVRKPCGSR